MSELQIYTGKDGTTMAIGPGGEHARLEEFCLSLRCPETGIRVGQLILFADGSTLDINGNGGSRPPTANKFETPGRCEKLIWRYWNERFNRASKAFTDLKWNIKHRDAPSRADIDELKRLKKIVESTAVELKKAETAWRKTQPRFHHEFIEETAEDRKAESARAAHNARMSDEAAKIELNI